jgi:hypothetical protein
MSFDGHPQSILLFLNSDKVARILENPRIFRDLCMKLVDIEEKLDLLILGIRRLSVEVL